MGGCGSGCWLNLRMKVLGELGRCWCCMDVEAGFVKAAEYLGAGIGRLGSHSDLGEDAGSQYYNRVVEILRVKLDSCCCWNARRRGSDNKAGCCHCH